MVLLGEFGDLGFWILFLSTPSPSSFLFFSKKGLGFGFGDRGWSLMVMVKRIMRGDGGGVEGGQGEPAGGEGACRRRQQP